MTTLSLLEDFRLEAGGVELEVSPSSQRLLALLGLRPRLARTELAGLLWPDAPQARAHANLRSSLWRVTRAVPDLVVAQGETLRLHDAVAVDVRQWTRAARELIHTPGATAGVELGLLAADSADLLPGWYDDWVLDVRETLRQLHLHVLELVAVRLLEDGEFARAMDFALRAVAVDRLRETAHRLVVRIHLAEGNVSEARRQFAVCRTLLAAELGVPPSGELVALVAGHGVPWHPPTPSVLLASATRHRSALH